MHTNVKINNDQKIGMLKKKEWEIPIKSLNSFLVECLQWLPSAALHHEHLPPFRPELFHLQNKLNHQPSSSSTTNAFNIINILFILPLCILILYYCLQEWRKKRSTSSLATTSQSDPFTYHVVIIELIGVLGCISRCCGSYRNYRDSLFSGGNLLNSLTWTAQMFFYIVTALEWYLAIAILLH